MSRGIAPNTALTKSSVQRAKLTHRTPSPCQPSTHTQASDKLSFKFKFICNMNQILCFSLDSEIIKFFCF